MIKTGIVSATFRNKTVEEIIKLAQAFDLDAIEWSGDIHVPAGDLTNARRVGELTREAGLLTPSYASYFRAGQAAIPFQTVLDTAITLGAPHIRVWAGEKGSAVADPGYVNRVYEDLAAATALAGEQGVLVSVEHHENTLTDTLESSRNLLEAVEGLHTYWQPLLDRSVQKELNILKKLQGRLTNVHVHYRKQGLFVPLAEGRDCWAAYIEFLSQFTEDRYLFVEFVKDNDEDQFVEDVQFLRALLGRGTEHQEGFLRL